MTTGEENSGARFNKYRPGAENDASYWSNDWVLYRLTEIYFAKAEALMRKNGGKATAEAVQLINDCRKRAFSDADWETEKYTTATLTLDELLEERGREFIFEGKRRTDLIRFGKFLTESWWDHKPITSEHLEWYPIPKTQRELNPNLVQNPGYVEN
ncbi:RagB/SusD family nutrient uptake outer membrane protein [Dysgonomonas sp. Marseille-P4361]|uniref:RagB/SusD family nutrient uptake outer membrane protein n=1 Tax=Dysgonomonas sp. Marseille-P4361 TaxID=2161820 RepID=UPI002100C69D|nr:RagB/SusD family nutrient uptake outer membrane protein [Dysgonomonas sp. Marseille-P4361]